jgi:O-acetyl-ADP-ribose deacetylase (regulator of RNase III)
MGERNVAGTIVRAVHGDLTTEEVDAVVNAANSRLAHGGGVAGAISRAGGPTVQEESDRVVADRGPVPTGSAAVTGGGDLAARWVVHAVGPVFHGGPDDERLLRSAVVAALEAAAGVGARSIAFPAISAGIYGYPRQDATRVIAAGVVHWVARHPGSFDEVVLVGYDAAAAQDFATGLEAARE